jgi:hypothetical protein
MNKRIDLYLTLLICNLRLKLFLSNRAQLRRLPSIDEAMTAIGNARNAHDRKILVRNGLSSRVTRLTEKC